MWPLLCVCFFVGGRKIAPPSMVTGGPPCGWTRVHRKATANRTQRAPRPRNAANHQTKKRTTRTQSQACARVVCRRRSVGRGVALRLQPKVLQSSSREVRATATRRSTARREHSHRLAPCGVLPVDGTGGLKFTPWPHERPNS